jgi:superfamily II DNA or RNA helicase
MSRPVLTVSSDLCLSEADAALIAELKKILTIANPKYQAAKKYGRWVGKKFPQKLYFYKERQSGFYMPRGCARQVVQASLGTMGCQPEIIDRRRVFAECQFNFDGKLRPYQESAVAAMRQKDFGVLEAGTGSGKTIMALALIALRKQPAIVIVHTKELLYQWAEKVKSFLGIEAGLIGDGHFSLQPVTVAIVNSAKLKLEELRGNFGHILVDECHRVPTTLFTDVVSFFDGKYSLGLSATAYRREEVLTKIIYFYMGERVWQIDPQTLRDDGAILKPEILPRPTGFSYRYRDDYAAMMTALTLAGPRNSPSADDVLTESKKKNGTILLVSDRIAHCEKLVELLRERGCQPALLTGRVAPEQRAEIVEKIRAGELAILVSTLQLIGEGFDAQGLTTLVLAPPIKFSGRLRQVIGRILRPAAGKRARVYDYVDEKVGVLRASARQREQTYLSMV